MRARLPCRFGVKRSGDGYWADMRVLVTGWPSFLHGEATAGDVLSMRASATRSGSAGIAVDIA